MCTCKCTGRVQIVIVNILLAKSGFILLTSFKLVLVLFQSVCVLFSNVHLSSSSALYIVRCTDHFLAAVG